MSIILYYSTLFNIYLFVLRHYYQGDCKEAITHELSLFLSFFSWVLGFRVYTLVKHFKASLSLSLSKALFLSPSLHQQFSELWYLTWILNPNYSHLYSTTHKLDSLKSGLLPPLILVPHKTLTHGFGSK